VSEKIITAIAQFFTQRGLECVDVPILQPADPFLDVVGENLRRRIFMTENENGDALCLRPEFTIPVCLSHIKERRKTPQHYAYLGEVFRQHRRHGQAAGGFYQAGIEDLGNGNEAEADAGSLEKSLALLQTVAPQLEFTVFVGDHALFDRVLSAFGLPDFWQRRLARCFGHDVQLRGVLADLAETPPPLASLPPHITELLVHGTREELTAHIEKDMSKDRFSPTASRTPSEIAQRLKEKEQLTCFTFDQGKLAAMEEFLTLEVPLSQAVERLEYFAKDCHIDLDDVLSAFTARNQAIAQMGIALDRLRYDAAFGRPLDYYTSFVYEIRYQAHSSHILPHILIGGGRYDRLLQLLGSPVPIPAVGFSLWLDRLEDALS